MKDIKSSIQLQSGDYPLKERDYPLLCYAHLLTFLGKCATLGLEFHLFFFAGVVMGIILDFVVTIFFYLGIPLAICKNSEKTLTRKRAKKIVIINALCCWLFFSVLGVLINGSISNGAPTFLWSSIAYMILKDKCEEEQAENTENNVQTTTQTASGERILRPRGHKHKKKDTIKIVSFFWHPQRESNP